MRVITVTKGETYMFCFLKIGLAEKRADVLISDFVSNVGLFRELCLNLSISFVALFAFSFFCFNSADNAGYVSQLFDLDV